LSLQRGRQNIFSQPNQKFLNNNEWIIDLRKGDTTAAALLKKTGIDPTRAAFITDKPEPGIITVSEEPGAIWSRLLEAISKDHPEGTRLALIPGSSHQADTATDTVAFSNALAKTNHELVSVIRYENHWRDLSKAISTTVTKHPELSTLVSLDPHAMSTLHWRLKKIWPKAEIYTSFCDSGTLQLLHNGTVKAVVVDQTEKLGEMALQQLIENDGQPAQLLVPLEPALRQENALERVRLRRKVELLGKISAR